MEGGLEARARLDPGHMAANVINCDVSSGHLARPGSRRIVVMTLTGSGRGQFRSKREVRRKAVSLKRLFVGNVPYQSSETELKDWFSDSGIAVDTIHFIRDRATGQPRGFGFVEIHRDEEAERAIATCNGKSFQGRTLVVSEARPNPARERAGGRASGSRGTAPMFREARRMW